MEKMTERRRFVRHPVLYSAKYSVTSGTYRDEASNVSAGGIFISSHRAIDPGQRIRLRFPVFAFDKRPSVEGTVVRAQDRGFAVRFDTPIEDRFTNGDHFPEIDRERDSSP